MLGDILALLVFRPIILRNILLAIDLFIRKVILLIVHDVLVALRVLVLQSILLETAIRDLVIARRAVMLSLLGLLLDVMVRIFHRYI